MKVCTFILMALVGVTSPLEMFPVVADENTSVSVSVEQQEVWNGHVVELLRIARGPTDKDAVSKAQQHYADAVSILPSPELEHAIAITLFSAGRYTDAARHLEEQLQHQSEHDPTAAMLYCRCCLHSGGRYLSNVVNFAKTTIDVMEKKQSLNATDAQLLQVVGSVVAVVPELDRAPVRTVKQLATLDRTVRRNRNSQLLRNYLTGYDSIDELLVSNAGAVSGRALSDNIVREEKLEKIAEGKGQVDAQQAALAAQQKASAVAVQKQVDAIDKWIVPRQAVAQQFLARHHILGLQIVQLQAAMQSSEITQIQRLQLLKSQEQCVTEKNNIEVQLRPFVARVNERRRLAEMYKAQSGQQLKANAELAALEQKLNSQQESLSERVTETTRGKLSNGDAIAIVFPIDVTTSTTNLATVLNLVVPDE